MDGNRIFSYDEALGLFPLVRDLTDSAVRQIEALLNPIQSRDEMETRREEIEATYRRIVDAWSEELQSLGCVVKGPWLVDFDNGDGFYCWKYPEQSLAFFHTYEDGFAGRLPVV
jgi:hypothetical protein